MEEDARREAAIAGAACLQPNFVPKTTKITSAHLSKLQELHKRRLQIKSKSKPKLEKKIKGKGKSHEKEIIINVDQENSSVAASSNGSSSSLMESPPPVHPQNRRKLRWGLDTKERWEMKANM